MSLSPIQTMAAGGFSCCCIQCMPEATYGVIQFCGKYRTNIGPGFNCIAVPCDEVYKVMSLRLQHLELVVGTKSKDDVTLDCSVAVEYKVHESSGEELTSTSLYDAVYSLTDVRTQIRNYVEDVVRQILAKMPLDEIFSSKDFVSNSTKEQLQDLMSKYGYDIKAVLITHLQPDANVARSMNEINASARLRSAAKEKAEAEKILKVKAAEADAESKYLLGAGVAKQRKAIVDGLKNTVDEFSASVDGAGPKDVMDLLLLTQYFDMMKSLGSNTTGGGNTLFLPHGPSSVAGMRDELANNFLGAKNK